MCSMFSWKSVMNFYVVTVMGFLPGLKAFSQQRAGCIIAPAWITVGDDE